MEYRIAWMLPDVLYMHGERGNVIALRRYAEAMGHNVTVDRIDFTTTDFNPDNYDALVFGVGEISSFVDVIPWLEGYRAGLLDYIESGRPMIVTGTSQAMFANKITRDDGSIIQGLGFIPANVVENSAVYGDDLIVDAVYDGIEMQLAGSQIMMMDIHDNNIDSDANVWGELSYGYGNNGKSREEGYVLNNAVFTNMLGPVLICNPWLTVAMVRASEKYRGVEPTEIDESFELENKSLTEKIKFNMEKTTQLTNHL